jgi:hypothetical protein
LQGFKYFKFYLRGREELIVTVVNDSKVGAISALQGILISYIE